MKVIANKSFKYITPFSRKHLRIEGGDVFTDSEIVNDLLNKGLAKEVEEQPIKKAEYSNATPSKEVSPAPKKRYKKKAD